MSFRTGNSISGVRRRTVPCAVFREEVENLVDPFAGDALMRATGAPSCAESAARIDDAAAGSQVVGHVQDHERRDTQARIGAASMR
jgi:class 3 adenylate cyclase